ncbi:zinc ABC transporter substrate-binding protein [Pleurocapsales cyanobacterium LEGE 10410]|nr:zinc ABC transporter substrate-binding protein [Pleurocapsales cyanobacterium LEGE 10410]
MLKNVIKILVILTTTGITAGLVSQRPKFSDNMALAQSKPKVVGSHSVICDLVETIAEDTVDLTCLIDGDQDPHTYSPTPSDRKAIEEARLILYGGYQLEPGLIKLIGARDPEAEAEETPQVAKIALYEQVVAEPVMAEHHEHHEHHEESKAENSQPKLEPDPHVWHNIEHTVAMVEYLESIFLQANPTASEQYLLNSNALTERLWQLDAWIKEQIATIPEGQRILVTTHNSLNYYVQAYYFDGYKTLQGLNADSPTASQVRELAAEIEQTEVPTIFAESTKSDRVINNVARAADVELSTTKLYVDGLGEANNYIEMMSHNTCAIVNGLGGKCQPFELNI